MYTTMGVDNAKLEASSAFRSSLRLIPLGSILVDTFWEIIDENPVIKMIDKQGSYKMLANTRTYITMGDMKYVFPVSLYRTKVPLQIVLEFYSRINIKYDEFLKRILNNTLKAFLVVKAYYQNTVLTESPFDLNKMLETHKRPSPYNCDDFLNKLAQNYMEINGSIYINTEDGLWVTKILNDIATKSLKMREILNNFPHGV